MIHCGVVVTNNVKRVEFAVNSYIKNSQHSIGCIVVWDGSFCPQELLDYKTEMGDNISIVLGHGLDVYGMFNLGVTKLKSGAEHVLLFNDDMYFPPYYDDGLDI
jgi:hypothetical protein